MFSDFIVTNVTIFEEFQQPSLGELECLITMQKSEIELLKEKLKKASLNLVEHNLYTTDTLKTSNLRSGRKREVG